MKYVLDSNVVVAALNGVVSVRDRLASVSGTEVGIPIVAVAELLYGAYRSRRREENVERVRRLRETFVVLPVSDAVVDLYGRHRAELASRGVAKSDFDLLIACTAIDQGAVLVTHDGGLLDGAIGDLRAEDWLAHG